MHRAYVIYNGVNLYWVNHLNGWADNIAHATWYGDIYDARQDAIACGGRIVSIDEDAMSRREVPVFA